MKGECVKTCLYKEREKNEKSVYTKTCYRKPSWSAYKPNKGGFSHRLCNVLIEAGFTITMVNMSKSLYKFQKCHREIYYIAFLITDVDLTMLILVFVVVLVSLTLLVVAIF